MPGIHDGIAKPNPNGLLIKKWWRKLPERFPGVRLDAFVVMPNHFHGILEIAQAPDPSCPSRLSHMIAWFKTMSTNEYLRQIRQEDPHAFAKLWQRNYWETIIRTPGELKSQRQYIMNNPKTWQQDPENPTPN